MKVRVCFILAIAGGCASSTSVAPTATTEAPSAIELAWQEVFAAKEEANYRRATATFKAHVAANPSDREAHNRYGKLLYAQGRWRQAADAFEAVATGDDYFARAAARNAILAWRRVLDGVEVEFTPLVKTQEIDRTALDFHWDPVRFGRLEPGRYKPLAIPAVEQRLVDAVDRYLAIAEADAEFLPTMQLVSAHSYFRYHHFTKAADRCVALVERWPRDRLAGVCGGQILNMFFASERMEDLERYTRRIWKQRSKLSGDPELLTSIEDALYDAAFQNVWNQMQAAQRKRGRAKKKLLLEAAERFRRYQNEFPDSPHADKALFNALAQYVNCRLHDDAALVASVIVEDYPLSEVAPQARQVLASLGR